ncbi:DgyrCDS3037 [Dimorphilus gyrociliatus]|uniref:protein-tyrosine-phosphatase n=1 Tax=Dimorphilus gyrociliatus TaxID=2664684 RepID=A0A7I8VER6_9ANNE|nr:DgyrCDS3037 [Dimorphilus gyrociliatus]
MEKLECETNKIVRIKEPFVNSKLPTERWFHGVLSASAATELLNRSDVEDNTFLIRYSSSNYDDFTLSVRKQDKIIHLKIKYQDEDYLIGGKRFSTLTDFVDYHRVWGFVCKDSESPIHLNLPYKNNRILLNMLDDKVKEFRDTDDLHLEFKEIGRVNFENLTTDEGKKLCNKSKNRYKNVLPIDLTRVKLTSNSKEKQNEGDYINANYIKVPFIDANICTNKAVSRLMNNCTSTLEDYRSHEIPTFIATQGCLPHTIEDFWTMIWNENTRLIVMLTKEKDGQKKKCAVYWPIEIQDTKCFSDIKIQLLEENNDKAFTVRSIKIIKDEEERLVQQFQFKGWPDHGILEYTEIVQLIEDMRAERAKTPQAGPVVVHCSAGIGRTGTIIAIQILLDQIEAGAQSIDVQNVVIGLRSQRQNMVQTSEQYRLIYEAVNQWTIDKNESKNTEDN